MLVVLLTASAFALVSFGARADTGGYDAYGYYWVDNNEPYSSVTFDWIDITGTGTSTGLYGDDSSGGAYPIGFQFEFYGNTYSAFNLTTTAHPIRAAAQPISATTRSRAPAPRATSSPRAGTTSSHTPGASTTRHSGSTATLTSTSSSSTTTCTGTATTTT